MFCKNCGKEINTNEKFCSNCGTQINEIANNTKEKNNIGKKKKNLGTIVVLCLLFFIIVGIGISSTFTTTPPTNSNIISKDSTSNTQSSIQENIINLGETLTGKDWEFNIKDSYFGQRINPPETPSFYTYYQVKDTDNTYLAIVLNVKNLSSLELKASNFANVKAKYNNSYTYSSFSAIPDKNLGFTYTNITNIKPLTSNDIYFLIEMPKSIADETDTPLQIEIKTENKTYLYNYR